jgi:multiple antibiotic resistance protein
MDDFAQFALVTFTSILFLVDPIAVVPTFLAITQGESVEQRRATARRACLAAAILLIVFAAAGNLIFRAFGITLPAFRIAGGAILWLVAMDMLRGERTTQESEAEIDEGRLKEDVAFTPLAMPMLAGPGAISTVMVLSGQARTPARASVIYVSIVLTLLISWIMLRIGDRVMSRFGQTGIRVTMRIMGLMLAAVAVQFIITGVREALASSQAEMIGGGP